MASVRTPENSIRSLAASRKYGLGGCVRMCVWFVVAHTARETTNTKKKKKRKKKKKGVGG